MLDEVLRAGGPTGTEIQPVMRIREPDEAESAFVAMVRERVDAVVIQGSLAIKSVTDLAIKYRLPTASSTRTLADIGGLMSFSADGPASFRHGAKFVHRILQGQQPNDLPIDLGFNLMCPDRAPPCRPERPSFTIHAASLLQVTVRDCSLHERK
jgi:ABC-type uncharacterized transport system substrate-binding protein